MYDGIIEEYACRGLDKPDSPARLPAEKHVDKLPRWALIKLSGLLLLFESMVYTN